MPERQAALPQPRTVVHPGPLEALRIDARCASHGRHFRLLLSGGQTLFDAVRLALADAGVASASLSLFDGDLSHLAYFLGQEDKSGQVVANYGEAQVTRAARLIAGNATLGKSPTGEPFLHCHAMFRLADGAVRGGHLLTDQTVIGSQPVKVRVTSLEGFDPCIVHDPETRLSLFRPKWLAEQTLAASPEMPGGRHD